ncbi:MAG: hypothetical protein ABSC94_12985 [Polyangiaceae bacterium]|jgi:hypothetical protein
MTAEQSHANSSGRSGIDGDTFAERVEQGRQGESIRVVTPESRARGSNSERECSSANQRIGGLMKKPSVGAAISGTLVLGAATAFGVLETSIAAGAAYLAYRLIKGKDRSAP